MCPFDSRRKFVRKVKKAIVQSYRKPVRKQDFCKIFKKLILVPSGKVRDVDLTVSVSPKKKGRRREVDLTNFLLTEHE